MNEIKALLRDTCLPNLAGKYKYFSIHAVRDCIRSHGCSVQPATLRKYLYGLRKESVLFDAGYGWYSTLPETFKLDKSPVSELVALLEKQYPLLEFSAWSTGQIKGFTHDTLAKFVAFVYVERHNVSPVADWLRDAGYDVYANPRGKAQQAFTVRGKTVVVRPRVTTQTVDGHYATVEAILVDLFVEARSLSLMGLTECTTVFENLAGRYRILMARLFSYAQQRKPATADLFKATKSTFSGFVKYP